ncbi:MAG: beta-lactamase family protein [Chloroflexi bacterium]|nr:beta-lactamase family protein [Chloroflexota bacterium]
MVIAESRAVAPESVGLNTSRLARIEEVVQRYIDRGVIAGAVTLISRRGQVAHLEAHGHMDVAAGRAVQPDTIFRLASMTKPVVSVAILTLFEAGKLLLTDPVSAFLPMFKEMQVATPEGLVPASREITLFDLLTHTSGLGSAPSGASFDAWSRVLQERPAGATLADLVPRMASTPLSFQPGTAWEYSGVFGFDTLARVVEVVSGIGFEQYLQQQIFEPLGIKDTTFHVPPEKMSRVTVAYQRGPNGLEAGTPGNILGDSTNPNARYTSGGGGLAGTAEDYARFGDMLCNGGQLDEERILSRKTVELMASNHIRDLPLILGASDLRGYRFGLGVRVLDSPAAACTLLSRGSFGWAGAFGTNSWIDPVEQMVGIMLIQRMPDMTDSELRTLWPRIQNTAYQALED